MPDLGQLNISRRANGFWNRRLAYGLIGLIAVALIATGVKQGRDWLQIRTLVAELHEQGEPLTFDELVASYHDARQGDDLTERWRDLCATIGEAMRRAAQEKEPSMDEFFRDQAETLSTLHELATVQGFVRLPLEQEPDTGFVNLVRRATAPYDGPPEFAAFQRRPPDDLLATCMCLCSEAQFHAEHGSSDGAAKALCTGLALAHTLDQVPTTIGLLQRAGLRNRVRVQLKELLPTGIFSAADLTRLQSELGKESDLPDDVRWAYRGERVGGIAAFDIAWNRGDWLYKSWFFRADKLFYLRGIQEMSDQSQLPYHEAKTLPSTIDEQRNNYIIASGLLPLVRTLHQVFTRDLAAGRVALVAVALTRYQLDHAGPPEKLADLVPTYLNEPPTDPLFAAPLQFDVKPEGFMVFSPQTGWGLSEDNRDAETGYDKILLYWFRTRTDGETVVE